MTSPVPHSFEPSRGVEPGSAAPTQGGGPALNRLERLTSRLYSPTPGAEVRRRKLTPSRERPAAPDWASGAQSVSADDYVDSIRQRPQSPFAKILVVAAVFFVAALSYGGWKLFGGGAFAVSEGSEDVRITVAGPNEAPGGDAFYFDVVVQNASPVPLLLPDLIVDFPAGTKDAETKSHDLLETRISLGDVAPGATVRKTVGGALFGNEGEAKNFQVHVQYRSPGSDAIFEKGRSYDVAIAQAPIRVAVNAYDRVTSGQAMPLEIHVTSNAPSPVADVGLAVSLPYGYTATGYSTPPSSGTFWNLGTVAPGEDRVIRVDGTLEGSDGDQRTFKFQVGQAATSSGAVAVQYSAKQVTVAVEKPFLGMTLALGGDASPAVARPATRQIDGLLTLTNNTDQAVRDVAVDVKFTGATLDRASVLTPYGSWSSSKGIAHWDKASSPALASIEPGKSVILSVSFRSLPLVSTGSSLFRDPEIVLDLAAAGRRVAEGGVATDIKTSGARHVRLLSDVAIEPTRTYVSGAHPPKADQPTSYRVDWLVRNSSSDLTGVTVKAPLPPQVSWAEQGAGGVPGLSFDAPSRTLIWTIGDLPAGAGYGEPAPKVSFTLTLTPAATQVGSYPQLLGATTLTGNDAFADARVTESANPLETEHSKDLSSDPGKVVP